MVVICYKSKYFEPPHAVWQQY